MELFDDKPYSPAELDAVEDGRSWVNVSRDLLNARLSLDYTQARVAQIAGTKQSRVSEIEAMTGNPRFDTLDRVARAVGLMVALVPRTPAAVDSTELSGLSECHVIEVGSGLATALATTTSANNNFALAG